MKRLSRNLQSVKRYVEECTMNVLKHECSYSAY